MGNTALQLAVSHGYSSSHLHTVHAVLATCAKMTLENESMALPISAMLESRDHGGSTALLSAAQWGNATLVAAMLQYGANPFSLRTGADHSSALHWAMRRGNARMAWSLLRAGGWPLLLLRTRAGVAAPAGAADKPPRAFSTAGIAHSADQSTSTSCWGSFNQRGPQTQHRRGRQLSDAGAASAAGTVDCSDSDTASSVSQHSDGSATVPHAPPNSPVSHPSWGSGGTGWELHKADRQVREFGCTPLAAAEGAGFIPLALAVRGWGHAALLATAACHAEMGTAQAGAAAAAGGSTGLGRAGSCRCKLGIDHDQAMQVLGQLPCDVAARIAAMLL